MGLVDGLVSSMRGASPLRYTARSAAGATAIEPNAAQVATVESTTNAVIAHDVPVHMEAMDARAPPNYTGAACWTPSPCPRM